MSRRSRNWGQIRNCRICTSHVIAGRSDARVRKIPQTATPATRHLVAGRAALDRAAQALDRALRAGEISEYEHHRLARQVWSVGDAVTRTVRDREADRAAAKTAKCFWCGERIVQARGGEWVKWGRSDTYCGWRRRRDRSTRSDRRSTRRRARAIGGGSGASSLTRRQPAVATACEEVAQAHTESAGPEVVPDLRFRARDWSRGWSNDWSHTGYQRRSCAARSGAPRS